MGFLPFSIFNSIIFKTSWVISIAFASVMMNWKKKNIMKKIGHNVGCRWWYMTWIESCCCCFFFIILASIFCFAALESPLSTSIVGSGRIFSFLEFNLLAKLMDSPFDYIFSFDEDDCTKFDVHASDRLKILQKYSGKKDSSKLVDSRNRKLFDLRDGKRNK